MFRAIQSRPSACCAPSSRRRISAPPSRRAPHNDSSMAGYTPRYDYALLTLSELTYDKWREYDAEDTIRFYALCMREAGMIKSSHRRSSPTAPTGASSTRSNQS
jgi:hypothetical protein